MNRPDQTLLRCEDVHVSRGRREVVAGVSFALGRGEVVALLGPNGAGKSTLLDAIGGLLVPSSGMIERRGRVAVALQSPDLANRSVTANLTAALSWWHVPRAERPARARAALAAMSAGHLGDRPARELSGGERRRVHLARALALEPDVLVLDEPFAGLDARIRGDLLADTGAALRSSTRAALVVVHDRAEAWALADRVLVLLGGRILADGSPRELLARPPSLEVARFLGFDGELRADDGSLLLTRPQHISIDPAGPLHARVESLIPTEDGARLALTLEHGCVHAMTPEPSPRPGDEVRLRIDGGVRYSDSVQAAPEAEPTVAPAAAQSRRP